MVMVMNLYMILLMALFPFLHEQRYTVTIHSCEQDKIIVEEGNTPFEITLFNLKITDEKGWETTCKLLEKADQIEIEVDSSTKIVEPLPVYVFADQELVQETLIREHHAYTQIHNPEYRYQDRLLKLEEATSTMAVSTNPKSEHKKRSSGWLFLLFIFLSWLIMIVYGLKKLCKLPYSNPFTKS